MHILRTICVIRLQSVKATKKQVLATCYPNLFLEQRVLLVEGFLSREDFVVGSFDKTRRLCPARYVLCAAALLNDERRTAALHELLRTSARSLSLN